MSLREGRIEFSYNVEEHEGLLNSFIDICRKFKQEFGPDIIMNPELNSPVASGTWDYKSNHFSIDIQVKSESVNGNLSVFENTPILKFILILRDQNNDEIKNSPEKMIKFLDEYEQAKKIIENFVKKLDPKSS
ncbi:MAG: hypothetical protein H6622_12640 [Halobacteriovoraceae bacterium]|nr:hypothetical protein [Halobacteriovoraceae bacterium]